MVTLTKQLNTHLQAVSPMTEMNDWAIKKENNKYDTNKGYIQFIRNLIVV